MRGSIWFVAGFLLAYLWMLARWNRADLAEAYAEE